MKGPRAGLESFPTVGTWRTGIAATLIAERERWPLWVPVLAGCGIGAYFALPVEPPAGAGTVALAAVFAASAAARGRPEILPFLLALAAAVFGFAAAEFRAQRVAAPVLEKRIGSTALEGRILELEPLPDGQRLLLGELNFGTPGPKPERIRLRLKGSAELEPGERVKLRATLLPPPAPAQPGAFDFARQAWFERLGAVGVAYRPVEKLPETGSPGPWAEFKIAIERARHRLTRRILDSGIEPGAAAVAAALVTGEQNAIPKDLLIAYRESGLAHILSISGLHMSLLAGLVFFVVRGGLAAFERIALRHPIKKWAAAAALLITFAYLLISGQSVPALRSFLMCALVLIAVLADRTAISMRPVALAALAILALEPEALLSASFQMSFGAVVALVAVYERVRLPFADWRMKDQTGWWRLPLAYALGVALTTLVAGLATQPFAIYHFNRFVVWSLPANFLAVPLTGFWVMPCALAAMLLLPLGLDGPFWLAMGWGVAGVNAIAKAVAAWPHATLPVEAMPLSALLCFAFAGLWFCLWRERWRFLAFFPAALGILLHLADRPPDLLMSADGATMAVRDQDGALAFNVKSGDGFARDTWIKRNGSDLAPRFWPALEMDCDSSGCLWRKAGKTIALTRRLDALADDCGRIDLLASAVPLAGPWRRLCAGTAAIDRFDLWRGGAHAVWIGGKDIRIESVARWRGERPWTGTPKGRPRRQAAETRPAVPADFDDPPPGAEDF